MKEFHKKVPCEAPEGFHGFGRRTRDFTTKTTLNSSKLLNNELREEPHHLQESFTLQSGRSKLVSCA